MNWDLKKQLSTCLLVWIKNSLGGPVSNFHGLSTNTSIRQAAHLQSMGDEQGFVKCICKTACARKTCKCASNIRNHKFAT
jgi:hypothetical protein